jgi:hypothetical protein
MTASPRIVKRTELIGDIETSLQNADGNLLADIFEILYDAAFVEYHRDSDDFSVKVIEFNSGAE